MRRSLAVLLFSLGVAAPVARGAGSGNDFQTMPPCRILDTRQAAGPYGGPALQEGVARSFGLTGVCGIPAGAVAVSVNATVTNTAAEGFLVLYAGNIAAPATSNLSFSPGQTRASASIVGVAPDGTLKAVVGGGGTDLILDVNGYFASSAAPPTVTLDPVADQTIPTNTTLSLRLSGHSTDAAAALTYDLLAGPAGASVSPLGVFAFSPKEAQLGGDSATVRVRDGGGRSAQRAFQITITDHDHAPVLGPLPDDLTSVGASYTKALTATDPDAGDVLTFSLLSGPAGMTLSGQTLSWTPTSAQLGNWPVRVKVTDRAGLSSSGQFNVGIQFLVATDDAYTVTLGQTLTVNAPGVLANDLDPLSGPLTAAKLTDPAKGTLSAFNANGSFTFLAPPILPGPPFVPVVKYHVDVLNSFFDAPLVADLDGDGKPEIIIHSSNGAGQFGYQALKGTDGTALWTTPTLPPPNSDCTVGVLVAGSTFHGAIGDIDDSGHVSIVFPTSCGRDGGGNPARYAALNGSDGTFKWLSPPLGKLRQSGAPNNLAFGTVATLARLRTGETPSILVGRDIPYFTWGGKPMCDDAVSGWPAFVSCRAVFVLDGKDGSVRQSMAAPHPGVSPPEQAIYSNGFIPAVAADLDGDGNMEILFGAAVFNSDGSVRSNNNDPTSRFFTPWVGLGNFDDSPDIEIVRLEDGSFGGQVRLAVYKSDGRQLWALPIPTAYGIPTVADVDGTGRPSVVFNVDSSVCAVDYKGTYKWCHDAGTTSGVPNIAQLGVRMQVYDLDGDGIPEVITPLNPESLLFLDGKTGNVKFTYDMGAVNGGVSYPRWSDGLGGAAIADVDGSGHASIVTVWNGVYGTARLDVVKSQNNDWRPARKIFNQATYHFGDVNDDGTIPKTFVNNFATQATNVFGSQAQVLTPVDARLKSQTSFTYAASDGPVTSAPGKVTIDILPTNRPPAFVSRPPTRYVIGAFSYASQAVDPDPGDTVTYAIKNAQGNGATGCTIGASSGILSCSLNAGEQNIVLVATDSFGAAGYQTLQILPSAGPASVPNVVGQMQAAATTALVGAGFAVGNVTTIANAAPAGQVVGQNPGGGTSALLGSLVDLVLSLGPAVPPPPGPPPGLGNIKRIVVTPAASRNVTGDNIPFKATSVNNDGTGADITAFVTWSSSATGVATVSAAGVAHAAGAGTTTLTATAGGLSGQASLTVAARTNGDNTPPVAAITQPAGGGTVTGLTQVLGTATDANFLRYELALEASGDTTFSLIGQGTNQVTNGLLGTLDPTLLLNGAYTLRLSVFDANGNTATADVPFVAAGSQKVGNFTLAYTDMTVSLSGIPIQIQRTYDSRDKRSGDFGVGWNLGLKALRVSASAVLGTKWQVVQQGTSFALVPGTDHFVSVTLPSGKVETFDLRVSPTSSFLTPFTTLFATFVARPGTLGTLQSLENVNLLILDPQPGPVTLVDDTSLNTFHPDRFLYTQRDGTQFVVWRTKGVESVKDTNGNQITLSPGGISHTSGVSIVFTRDGSGRITGITDLNGKTRTYAYSTAEDLASATDRTGNTTQYFYNAAHGLVRIVDPLGRPVSRSDYDDQGRLVSVTDANGNATTYQHDLPGRLEQVTDALGRITVIGYDERGNVLSRTDPLGRTTTSTYDAQDNQLTVTDPLGHTTSATYDAQNNVASITDPLGRTTSLTYDSAGHPLTVTDPRGHTSAAQYDANGNIVGNTDPLGHVSTYGNDSAGNPTSLASPAGAMSLNSYDALGRRTQLNDARGGVLSMHYDANGNLLSQQEGASGFTSGHTYDAENRIVGMTSGALQRSISYDATGRITTATTAWNQQMAIAFDPAGRMRSIADPAGVPLMGQAFDAVGNPVSVTDALGNRTMRTYDAADRPTSTTLPNGATDSWGFDADGRLTQYTNVLGHATTFGYDAAGELTSITDALGGQTVFQYDLNGNTIAQTDPAGHSTLFAYDELDRLMTTTFADGTTESRTYDADGRLASLTDSAGSVTTYSYDLGGNLVSITDPLAHVTLHAYQGAQRIATTDANGHTTQFTFDSSGRPAGTIHPLGDSETVTYDTTGNQVSATNGAGETVQAQYDAQGRLAKKTLPDGTSYAFTYTVDNLVSSIASSVGITFFSFDPATRRLIRVTQPDGRYVRYTHDPAGNRTLTAHGDGGGELATTYAYDALNRLIRITDPNGGVTTQTYDLASNVASITKPDGVTTTTTYDVRNRPVIITSRNAASLLLLQESYTLDALGNRTRVDQFGGSHVDYQYDALSRITRERHFDTSAVLQLDLVYAYDPAGNLVSAGPAALPVAFAFNADDELVSGGGVTYTYDLAGRRVKESFLQGASTVFRNYAWDAVDRLSSYQDETGATTTYAYDERGTRRAKGGATGAVSFLVDPEGLTGFSQLLRETSPSGTNTYVWGDRLLQTVEAGTPRFHLFDALGSTRVLVAGTGVATDRFDYDAWGQLLQHIGASGVRHRFTGEETDLESGLTYLRARYYDPRTRTFLTRDPVEGIPDEPLSFHPYLYASGNPVNRTDPSGQETLLELQITQAIDKINEKYTQIANIRKTVSQAKDVAIKAAREVGGLWAMLAVLETASNPAHVERWFNPLFGRRAGGKTKEVLALVPGLSDVLNAGETLGKAVDLAATLMLAKTAVDLLGGRDVDITISGFGVLLSSSSRSSDPLKNLERMTDVYKETGKCGPNILALGGWRRDKNDPKAFADAPATLSICSAYWTLPFIPTQKSLAAGNEPSQPGVMVHEFTHITLGTRDHAYGCQGFGGLVVRNLAFLALKNADSYRCWTEESLLGFGDKLKHP